MTDYGFPLVFGSFTTPSNADPARTVGLAVLAEQVGLDLVTFQDHPYQPGFLDTWTLLSFVAARTKTVHLSANVTNLPLRPPAVMARSVASLDLLSGGRIELGLGAGGFWDAIEAMGGRRLTAGQSVRAVEEAVEIIRQVWDTGTRGGVRVKGKVYTVAGAKRGPAPAHPVEIWLGAYRPRMLALTGRRADGWLPSLGYLQPGDLAAGNAMIDDAAEQAGRSPREIRRLLNVSGSFGIGGAGPLQGSAAQWAEELTAMALADGVSTFIIAADDPDDLRRFAAEVAPDVSEQVTSQRYSASSESAISTAAAISIATRGMPNVRTGFAVTPTADDGVRRSGTTVWDETARPTGPPADPHRSYTAREQSEGQLLVDIHNSLRAELAQLYDVIDQVAAGVVDVGAARSHINTMTMRQNNWTLGTYCESYCRLVTTHHTLEDRAMFPRLRYGDARLAPVLDRLEIEHHAIHDVLEGVDRALVRLVSQPDGLDQLRAAVDLLSDSLLSHLAYEERELVEPIARLGVVI